jgi:hypothetical protein
MDWVLLITALILLIYCGHVKSEVCKIQGYIDHQKKFNEETLCKVQGLMQAFINTDDKIEKMILEGRIHDIRRGDYEN